MEPIEPIEPERRAEKIWTKAEREAYVQRLYEAFIAKSVWVNHSAGNGHGDPSNINRNIKI